MPTKRRRIARTSALVLSEDAKFDLLGGTGHVGPGAPFRNERSRRAAWGAHRERLLASVNRGTRPAAWWQFESPVPRDHRLSQCRQLYWAGLLTAEELTTLRPQEVAEFDGPLPTWDDPMDALMELEE